MFDCLSECFPCCFIAQIRTSFPGWVDGDINFFCEMNICVKKCSNSCSKIDGRKNYILLLIIAIIAKFIGDTM